MQANPDASSKARGGAQLVALGILLSRIAGLIRERVFAHYFGNSDPGDAFKAALKIPNFLQNLFGEGVLSASFIPVYAGLLAQGKKDDASKVAGAIASILALVVSVLVLVGVLLTPALIDLIAPGFHGDKRELTIRLVQIFFPGTGLLVMSAWCLGILNSHRKFFLSYAAPVVWNLAIIGALISFGNRTNQSNLALKAAWGLVFGSFLQLAIQLPVAWALLGRLPLGFAGFFSPVRTVVSNFFPVVVSRGVVQVSAYIDNVLASFLPTGAVSALAYAQTVYLLPVSLFGMSVSAAELPRMSGALGTEEEIAHFLRDRLNSAQRQISYFVLPSVIAFLALGDVIVSAIFQTGAFSRENTLYVWAVLAGSTVGLLSATWGRIYSSAFYALRDTRTPLRFAIIRVILTTGLGAFAALVLPGWLGIRAAWGTVGLTASAGAAGWVEFLLLRRGMNRRTGPTGSPRSLQLMLLGVALVAVVPSWILKLLLSPWHPVPAAAIVLSVYGGCYIGLTSFFGVPEAQKLLGRFFKRARF